jgi:hypothetical protein
MRLLPLVWLSFTLAGCGSITLAEGGPDAAVGAPSGAAAAPDQGTGKGSPASPGCDKMCQSGNAGDDGSIKRASGHPCAKPPCDPGDQS